MSTFPRPLIALALLLALLAIGYDLYARRVPNTVLLGALGVAVMWQLAGLTGWTAVTAPGLAEAGLALGAALAAMLPLYALGWMGAGDVKLMAVLGFLLGLKPLLIVWVLANIIVGTHTFLIIATRFVVRRQPQLASLQLSWQNSGICRRIERPHQGRKGMPFAAYLGIGVFAFYFLAPFLKVMQ